jgi:FKBP-type peptidyl-prolyl cis-trans isomerase FkpA
MRLFKTMFCVAALGMAMSGCNNVDFKKTKGGMPYKLFPSKDGKKAVVGGYLKVNITTKKNDSVLQTTYGGAATYLPVTKESQPYDLSEIISTLKEGDSVYSVRLVDTFMKRTPGQLPPTFKAGDKIITTLKVLKVLSTEEETKQDYEKEQMTASAGQLKIDDKALSDYLAKNNIKADKIGSGTYVQVLQPGTGEQVATGKFVSLMYKGTTLAGKVFDTNMDSSFHHTDPMDMVVGSQPLIKGFEEGIKTLKEGAKAKLFIPSALAYGTNGPPEIGPNANLVFDMEVLKVANQPPPSNNMAPPTNAPTDR